MVLVLVRTFWKARSKPSDREPEAENKGGEGRVFSKLLLRDLSKDVDLAGSCFGRVKFETSEVYMLVGSIPRIAVEQRCGAYPSPSVIQDCQMTNAWPFFRVGEVHCALRANAPSHVSVFSFSEGS